MDYVQIWIGSKLVQAKTPHVCANDTHTIITDENMSDFVDKVMVSQWADGWKRMHDKIVVSVPPYPFNQFYAESDFLRLFLATSMPHMVYSDIDVAICDRIPAKDGPWFAATDMPSRVDHFLFSVAGNTGYFEKLLTAYVESEAITRNTLYCLNNCKVAGEWKQIPKEAFVHDGMKKWQR